MKSAENTLLELASKSTSISAEAIGKMINWEEEAEEAQTLKELEVVLKNLLYLKRESDAEAYYIAYKKVKDTLLDELVTTSTLEEIETVLDKAYSIFGGNANNSIIDKIKTKWDTCAMKEVDKARCVDGYAKVFVNSRLGSEPRKKAAQKIYRICKINYLR